MRTKILLAPLFIRVLGTLCLEPEAETSMSISYYFTMQKTILGPLVKYWSVDG